MDEKDTPLDDTSGTPESVVLDPSQVMVSRIRPVTVEMTEGASSSLPMMKQALTTWRLETRGAVVQVVSQRIYAWSEWSGVTYQRRRGQRQKPGEGLGTS